MVFVVLMSRHFIHALNRPVVAAVTAGSSLFAPANHRHELRAVTTPAKSLLWAPLLLLALEKKTFLDVFNAP